MTTEKMVVQVVVNNNHYPNEIRAVRELVYWKDHICRHPVTWDNLLYFMSLAYKSNQITYDHDSGSIDPFDDTPLFTNGQVTCCAVLINEVKIWEFPFNKN